MTSHVEAERLAQLADGLLDPASEHELRAHIDQCEPCFEAWAAEFLPLLAEGLLDSEDEEILRTHIDTCAQCSQSWSRYVRDLSEVPGILSAVAYPSLDAETANSVSALIQAESELAPTGGQEPHPRVDGTGAADQQQEPHGAEAESGTVLTLPSRGAHTRSNRWMPYLVAAAAIVFLLGGGTAILQATLGSDDPPALDGAASQDDTDTAPEEESPDAVLPAQPMLVASDTDYATTDLEDAATRVLSDSGVAAPGSGSSPEPGTDLSFPEPDGTPEDEAIQTCIEAFDTTTPLLVDVASFAGDPAWMLALPAGENGDYRIQVVTPGCPSGASDLMAQTTVPRP
ncbi:zf-HC2 domain-containing protein [Lipingzhangella sp. LS1_29]|uniref:Zf-HC2 domain-containing protein n=1 Tax=Lipingzhangella rawalii TaxID=2055835 RepID=A0ABU2H9D7_9ACTN|nr:zf-HC2 domain-containing protein [Lipingzhangella rawalii]MDS1271464.1 zf-HC2 domain-containing protein [Lipingzhangella rawalii]